MADALTIANAFRLAKGCVRDASLLLETHSRNAAYLAEQALEQVIRGFATSEKIHIERHDAHQLDKGCDDFRLLTARSACSNPSFGWKPMQRLSVTHCLRGGCLKDLTRRS